MKVGIVRVDAFKKMAWLVKKRIPGCKHSRALDSLGRACGMKSYREVLDIREIGLPTEQLMPASREELINVWRDRIGRQFDVDIDTIFTAGELNIWFAKVFVPQDQLVADAEAHDIVMKEISDPRLEAANWRDAEFRQWVQSVVDLEISRSRPEKLDSDDSGEASSSLRGASGHSSMALADE
jgi:hypothetical protein